MILFSNEYPKYAEAHKHGGEGEFLAETILTREQLGSAGRLFVRATLKPGHSVGMHAHTGDTEICYFLQGAGLVREEDGSETAVHAGDCNIVPSGHAHEIVNTGSGELVYLAIVLFTQT